MADELIENAEFGRKRKNEEEPILVAQRFLNIYRQMHIFNKERQNQFDDMLLELSPDVRILLSTLPGGSLLLEHIEELEQKRGLVSAPIKKENAFRKKAGKENETSAEKGNKAAVGSVVIDSSFATELSSSLSLALQQTEKRYKDDIKTLTETITQSIMASQSAIANMMKDILIASRNKNFSGNDNVSLRAVSDENIPAVSKHVPTTAASDEGVNNRQSSEILVSENAEISKANETPQTETVKADDAPQTEAVKTDDVSQSEQVLQRSPLVTEESVETKENKSSKKQKNKKSETEKEFEAAPVNVPFFQSSRNFDSLSENFPDKTIQTISEKNLTAQTSELTREPDVQEKADILDNTQRTLPVLPSDTETSENISEPVENIATEENSNEKAPINFGKISALASDLAKKIGKNRKNKKATDDVLTEDISSTSTEDLSETTSLVTAADNLESTEKNADISDDFQTLTDGMEKIVPEQDTRIEEINIQDENQAFSNETGEAEDLSQKDLDISKEDFNFDDMLNDIQENKQDIFSIDNTTAAPGDKPDDALYKEELNQIREALQNSKPEKDINETVVEEEKKLNDTADNISESKRNFESPVMDKPDLSEPENFISLDDLPDTPISLDDISEDPISLDDFEDDSDYNQKNSTISEENTEASYSNPGDEQDWEWEYVDDNNANDEDWEWEYVEDDGNGGDDSEDWEWEYVEDNETPDNNNNK